MSCRAFLKGHYPSNSQNVHSTKKCTRPILGGYLERIIAFYMKQFSHTASNSETTAPEISGLHMHSSTGSKVERGLKAGLKVER